MTNLGMKLTRVFVAGALVITSVMLTIPSAQAVTVLEGPGHALSSSLLFDSGSTVLKPSIKTRLDGMLAQVPNGPWQVHVTVMTSEPTMIGRGHVVAQARINAVALYVKSQLEAAGVTVFEYKVNWYQPGLVPNYMKSLRYAYVDLHW